MINKIKHLTANLLPERVKFPFTLLLFFGCLFLMAVIPPLKSPDENNHIERAYLLGKAIVVLDKLEGKSSGGYIDSGLMEYIASYPPGKGVLSSEEIFSNENIKWSGHRIYDALPGTGYYFPVIYFPQMMGLMVGEKFDLTVDHSYRLARLFALITVALLLCTAFGVFPPNPLVFGLIVIPMTLFQISSASLDGVSTGLAIFSISAFMRIARDKGSSPTWILYALAFVAAILASSRIHTLPILILLAASYFYTKNKRELFLFFGSTFFVVAWTLYAMKVTVDFRVSIGESTLNIVAFYLHNPLQFFSVTWDTLSNIDLQNFYYKSFLGILGWLDVPFQDLYYAFFSGMLAVIAILSISFKGISEDWTQRLLLVFVSIISVLFIFFALLVTWSSHPAQTISGVQGRYFLIPSIIFAYAVGGYANSIDSIRLNIASLLVLGLFLLSIYSSVVIIINRYYLIDNKIETEKIILGLGDVTDPRNLIPSFPLVKSKSIELIFPYYGNEIGKISRIGIRLGTHMRTNPGAAEIVLMTRSGEVYSQKFSLPDLIDNSYKYFNVPANYYISGKILYESGGGISVWESHALHGGFYSCLAFRTVRNQFITVNGCP